MQHGSFSIRPAGTPAATGSAAPAAWHADPMGRFPYRYWDGTTWTAWVSDGRNQFVESSGPPADLMPTRRLADDPATRWLLPVGRSGWAIAAGYAGLLAFLIVFAPIALGLGVVAIVQLRRHPDQLGWGRAIFGTVVGALGTALLLAALVF